MKQNRIYIYGKHAVTEALRYAPQALTKVYLDPKDADAAFKKILQSANMPTAKLSEGLARADLQSGTAHQGVVGQLSVPQLMRPYEKWIDSLVITPDTSLVLLAGVQDPHNVGAIIRSAAGFGIAAVLMPEAGQAPVTGTVAKVSAGMAFRIPLVHVADMLHVISDLKKRGFMICGLAGESTHSLQTEAFEKPTVFILGNEGAGLPPHLRAQCDRILSIPMHSRTESLNVAAAGAIAFFAWSSRHGLALKK
jgi:predicted rRNA methylase